MSKIKIATDSAADVPKQFCEELNNSVLLLTILADGKARGERKVISALAERCMKERRSNSNYAIVYGYNTKALELLKETCAQVMDKPPMAEYQVGRIISINTCPNMIGILYHTWQKLF